jgi:hypothetical protein
MRFEVVGRSKLDGTGKLYLLLHLRLAGLMADTPCRLHRGGQQRVG